MANPRMWIFEQVRLAELLERRPLTDAPQVRRILDADGALVAEFASALDPPLLTRRHALYDAGTRVGWIEVSQSLRPLAVTSALLGLAALGAGALLVLVVRLGPLRAVARAERSREESERRYRSLYASMKEGLALFRIERPGSGPPRFPLLDANPAWEALAGVGRRDFAGAEVHGLLGGALEPYFEAAALGATPEEGFSCEVAAGDPPRILDVSVFFPEPGLVATLLNDRTEERRAQAEREGLLQRMLQSQKLEGLGLLAGGIAHDFNNLLVGILGNTDLALAKTPPGSQARAYLQRIETAALRAGDLANQILAYSGRGRFVVGPTSLSELVGEMAHLLETAISKRAVVRYDLAGGLPMVEADATQLRQLVMNLITNASDALGGDPGSITVTTGTVEGDLLAPGEARYGEALPPRECVYVEVADTGRGMDPDTRARIFDPFFTTKETGRGLGLAAALGIVRGHRGALIVRSAPGAGTTFRAVFPALEDRAAPAPGDTGSAPAREAAAASGTVLVVDDDETVRNVAREMLGARGFTVLTAVDGIEGVEVFRRHAREIRAVVLDMTMPRMDGEAAFREIQAIDPAVPVLICSGYAEVGASGSAALGRAAGFVQKPYRSEALVGKVIEVIGREAELRGR